MQTLALRNATRLRSRWFQAFKTFQMFQMPCGGSKFNVQEFNMSFHSAALKLSF
jgi:hypothetical protein